MGFMSAILQQWNITTGALVTFIVAFLVVSLLRRLLRFMHLFRLCQSIPGDPNYSIIYGNIQNSPKDYDEMIKSTQDYMENTNSRIKRFWLGPFEPLIYLYHPDLIKEFLKTAPPKTRGFGGGYEHSIPWFGESVLTSNGARWLRDRRLINGAFRQDVLKNYIPIFNSATDILLETIGKHADKGESFDMFKLASLCLLDIVAKSTMSLDIDAQRSQHPYVSATKQLAAIWALRNRTPKIWPSIIFRLSEVGKTFFRMCDYIHTIGDQIIATRKKILENKDASQCHRLDFLDLLLNAKDENGVAMTLKEVRENVDAIMFAGHDTGSSSICWFLYEMCRHPHHQLRIQEEVDRILTGRSNDNIDFDDFKSLEFLTMCIKESMRVNPAVPVFSRRIKTETEIDGKVFPKDTIIVIPIGAVHNNPAVWDKPLEYIPERFSSENVKNINMHSYMPFSAGSRNCPGQYFAMMELKVVLARILHRFDLELCKDGPPVKKVYELIVKAKDGLWFKAKRRHLD